MININGITITGDVTVNGNIVVTENGLRIMSGTVTKFDEKRYEEADKVEQILISSTVANVELFESNSSKVEVHLHGHAAIDGNMNFDVQLVNSELRIVFEIMGRCSNSALKVNVALPHKIYRLISVNTVSANVAVRDNVSVETLNVKTVSGNLETNATFTNASIVTKAGNVKLSANASKDINVDISVVSGNVSTEFNGIGHINLCTKTLVGSVQNCHKGGTGYTANVNIATKVGNICIR